MKKIFMIALLLLGSQPGLAGQLDADRDIRIQYLFLMLFGIAPQTTDLFDGISHYFSSEALTEEDEYVELSYNALAFENTQTHITVVSNNNIPFSLTPDEFEYLFDLGIIPSLYPAELGFTPRQYRVQISSQMLSFFIRFILSASSDERPRMTHEMHQWVQRLRNEARNYPDMSVSGILIQYLNLIFPPLQLPNPLHDRQRAQLKSPLKERSSKNPDDPRYRHVTKRRKPKKIEKENTPPSQIENEPRVFEPTIRRKPKKTQKQTISPAAAVESEVASTSESPTNVGNTYTGPQTLTVCTEHEFQGENRDDKTDATPKKGQSVSISLNTPGMDRTGGIVAIFNGQRVPVATSKRTDHGSGIIVFATSFNKRCQFAFDADHPLMNSLVAEFLEHYSHLHNPSFETLMTELSLFLYRNIRTMSHLIVRDLGLKNGELVCRHFAYFSGSILSKIMKKMGMSGWEVQIPSGYMFDSNLENTTGHAWNVITLVDEQTGETRYWLYDAYNFAYIEFQPHTHFSELTVVVFAQVILEEENEQLTESTPVQRLESERRIRLDLRDGFFYEYLKNTIEKFFLNKSTKSLYNPSNLPKLLQFVDLAHSLAGDTVLDTNPVTITQQVDEPVETISFSNSPNSDGPKSEEKDSKN